MPDTTKEIKDLESYLNLYKTQYKFLYTDELGEDLYLYENYKLTLEQIHLCETNYMTKACIIYDGHVCKELIGVEDYYHVISRSDDYIKLSGKITNKTIEGSICIDPWGKPHIYCL
jgi:hypothetical protein